MSAQSFTHTIFTASGGAPIFNTGLLATLKLEEVHPDTGVLLGNTYPAIAHIGNGQYDFGYIPYGCYKMYNGSTEIEGFHGTQEKGRWIGASSFDASIIDSGTLGESRLPTGINANKIGDGSISNTEFQRLNGIEDNIQDQLDDKASLTQPASPNAQWSFSGAYPLVDDAIEAPTDPRHVTTKDYVDTLDDAVVHKAGSETISGAKQFTGNVVINTGSATLSQSSYLAPTDGKHYAPKEYVDEQVASVRAVPFQEASNRVRVITNGTLETGKVYRSVGEASAYFGTPSATNPCFIDLVKGGTNGVFYINGSTTLKNHMTITGKGLESHVCLSDGNTSLTKTVTFQNLTLYFGINDNPAARTYNSFTFRDCVIYAYNDTTFSNCTFYNTIIIHASTKSASLNGCICWNSHFNQYVSADTPTLGFMTHGFDTGLSYYPMPTDPSLTP